MDVVFGGVSRKVLGRTREHGFQVERQEVGELKKTPLGPHILLCTQPPDCDTTGAILQNVAVWLMTHSPKWMTLYTVYKSEVDDTCIKVHPHSVVMVGYPPMKKGQKTESGWSQPGEWLNHIQASVHKFAWKAGLYT